MSCKGSNKNPFYNNHTKVFNLKRRFHKLPHSNYLVCRIFLTTAHSASKRACIESLFFFSNAKFA